MLGRKNTVVILLASFVLTLLIGCLNISSSNDNTSSNASTSEKIAESIANNAPTLSIPIDCKLGEDCFIMHYVDIDPTETELDFGCGRQTYDGHKGTDFGIADLKIMDEGIPVLAAASGTVLRTRDGIADKLVNDLEDKQAVADRECGNGVVIDHGNGWETQYCHLRQGSIAVQPNTEVKSGTVLGMVGTSGLASFPHVHFSIRHNGEIIDPFVGTKTTDCNQELNPLWVEKLNYTPSGSIDAGFTNSLPTQEQLWSGLHKNNARFPADTSPLIFWTHSYGVLQGDVEKWQLIAPDGTVAVEEENTIDKSFRSWFSYIGKREIIIGRWRGEYQLWRNRSLVLETNREIIIGEE